MVLDQRKNKQDRLPRERWCCTTCGKPLPRKRCLWGIVWDDKQTGVCVQCIERIRALK